MLITSNYVNRDELMLDLTVYGTLIQDSFKLDEFKELVKQEYLESRQKDLRTRPTSLSGLVSPDYAVQYDELELGEDEEELDFSELSVNSSPRFRSIEAVDAYIDKLREEIMASGDEDAIANLIKAEESFGTVKEADYVPHDVSEDSDEVQVWHTAEYDEHEDDEYESYTATGMNSPEETIDDDDEEEIVDLSVPESSDGDDEEEFIDLSFTGEDEEEEVDLSPIDDSDYEDTVEELTQGYADTVMETDSPALGDDLVDEFENAEFITEDEDFESLDLDEIFKIDEALLSSLEEEEGNSDSEIEDMSEPEDFDEDEEEFDEWDNPSDEEEVVVAKETDSDDEIDTDSDEISDFSDESDFEDSEDFEDDSEEFDGEEDEDSDEFDDWGTPEDSQSNDEQTVIEESDESEDEDNMDFEEEDDWGSEPEESLTVVESPVIVEDDDSFNDEEDFDEWGTDEPVEEPVIPVQETVIPVRKSTEQPKRVPTAGTNETEVKMVNKKPEQRRKEVSDDSFDDFLASVPKQVVQPTRVEPVQEAPPVVNRSAEPNDIRAFVRAHPHCTDADLEKYFTKKAISKAKILGKIIKKGKTYQI